MNTLCKVSDMVEMELEDITRKDRLSMTDVEALYKLVDIMKDVETITAMQEHDEDYSMRGSYRVSRMDRGERRGDYSRARNTRRARYSRDDSKEKMIEGLEEALEEATNENERHAIKHLMEKLSD